MSNYTENFTSTTGDTVDAAELETEFDAIATAIATKLDSDGSGTMTGALNMGSNKVTNVTDPTNDQDAATKAYVDEAEAAGFATIATTTIGLTETREGTVSCTIPTDWNEYYYTIVGSAYIVEATAMSSFANITIKIREGDGTAGTILQTLVGSLDTSAGTFMVPIYAGATGETTTGTITFSLTTETNGEGGKMELRGCKWQVIARRIS